MCIQMEINTYVVLKRHRNEPRRRSKWIRFPHIVSTNRTYGTYKKKQLH